MAFEYIAFNIKEEPLDIVAFDATGDADPLFDVPVAADQNYPEVTIKTESDDDSSNILYIKLEPDNVLSAVDQLDADEYYELALSKLMPLQEADILNAAKGVIKAKRGVTAKRKSEF